MSLRPTNLPNFQLIISHMITFSQNHQSDYNQFNISKKTNQDYTRKYDLDGTMP